MCSFFLPLCTTVPGGPGPEVGRGGGLNPPADLAPRSSLRLSSSVALSILYVPAPTSQFCPEPPAVLLPTGTSVTWQKTARQIIHGGLVNKVGVHVCPECSAVKQRW